jgi:tetratricopeptide (TPR) repeat protein
MSRYLAFALSILLVCAAAPLHPQQSLSRSHPKYRTAKKVFDNPIRAIGDGRTKPRLDLQPEAVGSHMQVAWFSPEQNAVTLQERAYDLCISLGADSLNALAALLGHELAHCYQDHGWVGDFGNGFADLPVGQLLKEHKKEMVRLVKVETEADVFGGFYGYVAGYNTLGVAPQMLQQVYREYELGDAIPGYPTLQERQQIAQRSAQELQRKIPVFEAGHALLLLGRYEEGARCFDYIARNFPSREILNNAGVSRALEAIGLFEEGELRFAYPFELDAATRLRDGGKADQYGYIETREERRTLLLEEAAELFAEAGRKDPDYATAFINLACVADLQGEHEETIDLAAKALRIATRTEEEVSQAHALVARGIALANGEDADEAAARQDFERAQSGSPSLARFNLGVLDPEKMDLAGRSRGGGEKHSPRREKIHGLSVQDYDHIIDAADGIVVEVPREGKGKPAITVYAGQSPDWNGLVIDTGSSTIFLLATVEGYEGESGRGLRIGSDLEQMREVYGHAGVVVAGRQGTYHAYGRMRGIIFQTEAGGRVTEWMLYGIEE